MAHWILAIALLEKTLPSERPRRVNDTSQPVLISERTVFFQLGGAPKARQANIAGIGELQCVALRIQQKSCKKTKPQSTSGKVRRDLRVNWRATPTGMRRNRFRTPIADACGPIASHKEVPPALFALHSGQVGNLPAPWQSGRKRKRRQFSTSISERNKLERKRPMPLWL